MPPLKIPHPILKLKNDTGILSKTNYSTPNLTLYLLTIKVGSIKATEVQKTQQLFQVDFSSLSGSVFVNNSSQHNWIIQKMASNESSQTEIQNKLLFF